MSEMPIGPLHRKARMKKTAWTTLEDVLRPIRNARTYSIEERIRRTNAHLETVVKDSYPDPITDAIIDQALVVAREGLDGSLAARIVDTRTR